MVMDTVARETTVSGKSSSLLTNGNHSYTKKQICTHKEHISPRDKIIRNSDRKEGIFCWLESSPLLRKGAEYFRILLVFVLGNSFSGSNLVAKGANNISTIISLVLV